MNSEFKEVLPNTECSCKECLCVDCMCNKEDSVQSDELPET